MVYKAKHGLTIGFYIVEDASAVQLSNSKSLYQTWCINWNKRVFIVTYLKLLQEHILVVPFTVTKAGVCPKWLDGSFITPEMMVGTVTLVRLKLSDLWIIIHVHHYWKLWSHIRTFQFSLHSTLLTIKPSQLFNHQFHVGYFSLSSLSYMSYPTYDVFPAQSITACIKV